MKLLIGVLWLEFCSVWETKKKNKFHIWTSWDSYKRYITREESLKDLRNLTLQSLNNNLSVQHMIRASNFRISKSKIFFFSILIQIFLSNLVLFIYIEQIFFFLLKIYTSRCLFLDKFLVKNINCDICKILQNIII